MLRKKNSYTSSLGPIETYHSEGSLVLDDKKKYQSLPRRFSKGNYGYLFLDYSSLLL